MNNRSAIALVLVAAGVASPGCQCDSVISSASGTTLTIESPGIDTVFGPTDTFNFSAQASNAGGIASVSLYGGPTTAPTCATIADCGGNGTCTEASTCIAQQLNVCTNSSKFGSPLGCAYSFSIAANTALIVNGQIALTAISVDYRGRTMSKSIFVNVGPGAPADAGPQDSGPEDAGPQDAGPQDSGPEDAGPQDAGPGLTIVFTQPTPNAGTNPPTASVAGITPVAVDVTNNWPLASVVITYDANLSLASWTTAPVTGPVFQQPVNWEMTMGTGTHLMTATATDTAGDVATATLSVTVGGPGITFTAPTLTAGTNPSVADVEGTSPVAVAVTAFLPLASVTITYDNNMPLAAWNTLPVVGPNFSQSVNWNTAVGPGMHTLTAVAIDNSGAQATATLQINVGQPTIVFTEPTITPGTNPQAADVAGTSRVAVAVTSLVPLTSVVITYDANLPLASWTRNLTGGTFGQMENWATLGSGPHVLTAVATDSDGLTATATLNINVMLPTIVFTEPTITPGTNPAVADVGGTSAMTVAVTSLLPLTSVVVTYDNNLPLASWPNNQGPTFTQMQDWTALGAGAHTLKAVATDNAGETATATLNIVVEKLSIVFTEPTLTAGTNPAVADVAGTSAMTVAVTSLLALSTVVVTYDSGTSLASWSNNNGPTFTQNETWRNLGVGAHTLKAVATDVQGETATATLNIVVQVPTIVFTAPAITSGTTADVSTPSDVAVLVTHPLPLTTVVVTYGNGTQLASWPLNQGPAMSQLETWDTAPGVGSFTLTAVATQTDGETATATLNIVVASTKCTSDSDCTGTERCCTNDGTCNPVVGSGGECSCDQPCPTNEGCFPGVCGQTPSQCYAGCDPGCQTGVPDQPAACSAYPHGKLPDSCPDVNGQPAFCNLLPANQQTTANKGGACIQGDPCSVTTQNCGMKPLDRSQPENATTNPLVAYNCVPEYPGVNGCIPAGTYTMGETDCTSGCGTVAGGTAATKTYCAAGSECVTSVGANGKPLGPAACELQCNTPNAQGNPVAGCDPMSDDATCSKVYEPYGTLDEYFTTGSCCVIQGGKCTQGGECCDAVCGNDGKCD